MAVDLRILHDDAATVVLRQYASPVHIVLPLIVCGAFLAASVHDPRISLLASFMGGPGLLIEQTALLVVILFKLRTLGFGLWTTTTFRAGSGLIEQRQGGLIWRSRIDLDGQGAHVRVGVTEPADEDRDNNRVYAPSGSRLDLMLTDRKPLRLGCIDAGHAMLLVDRLNTILRTGGSPLIQ